jgi:hypothetical protein
MKNILRSIILAPLLVSSAMAGGWTVVTGDLTFQGYGNWVTPKGDHGLYTTYEKTWSQCYNSCMSTHTCTGVEFSIRANGRSVCEIHRGEFKGYEKGRTYTTVWTK